MPKPLDGIVEALQAALRNHWSQIVLYTEQAEHFRRWGYQKLAETFDAYLAEERSHAQECVARLEFFDRQPLSQFDTPLWPRHDFEGILKVNYDLDAKAAGDERAGYIIAVAVGDAETAAIFARLLKGSEDGMAEIEAIRLTITQIGIDNYLSIQV